MRTIFVVGHANRERTKIVVAGQDRSRTRPAGRRAVPVRILKPRPYPRGDFRAAPTGGRDTVH